MRNEREVARLLGLSQLTFRDRSGVGYGAIGATKSYPTPPTTNTSAILKAGEWAEPT